MPNPRRVPFHLVDHAMRRLRDRLPDKPVIEEYWTPQQKWRRWEYLDQSLKIEECLKEPPDQASVLLSKKMLDAALARRLWPLTTRFDPTLLGGR